MTVMEALRCLEDVSQVRSILSLCNVYRRFVNEFAINDAHSKKALKNGEPNKFFLDKQAQQAVDELKTRLINPPVLALQRLKRKYSVDPNVLNTQVGWVLLHEQEKKP